MRCTHTWEQQQFVAEFAPTHFPILNICANVYSWLCTSTTLAIRLEWKFETTGNAALPLSSSTADPFWCDVANAISCILLLRTTRSNSLTLRMGPAAAAAAAFRILEPVVSWDEENSGISWPIACCFAAQMATTRHASPTTSMLWYGRLGQENGTISR